ncbi:multicopper oxidase family protein [Alteribacillus bidgolensis]|uniref:Copper-containing nitrite reductase n=1 Tax=Alteribacillus bidgolensis TaxID=930129 RepID=A0A1G8R7Q9_9BACI|nr:multicopper oxidase domain-containing protein [Alteribacillus bidgolensis]SDJ13001.1 Multicopper oxidase [Alteribacillus bidgolensis]
MNWEQRVSMPDVTIAPYQRGNNTRYFKLIAEPIHHNILSDIMLEALGYNGTTPGPLIVMEQGEWIQLEVENRLDEPTSLHVHGLSKPNSQDGIPEIEPTPFIQPGESYIYQFQAWQEGSFFYHAGPVLQVTQGLIGAFIVLPRQENIHPFCLPDRDYILLIQQWQIEQPELGEVFPGTYKPNKFAQQPNFFTINGKAFPETSPMYTKYGERIRLRFINKTNASHSMHTHGHDFHVVSVDGFPRTTMDDTISVASGQRWDVEFYANNPGVWPINGTKTFHQTNNGKTPGGMITRLQYV